MDLDIFDAQGRFVAVAAERVQDLPTVSLTCSARAASWPASTGRLLGLRDHCRMCDEIMVGGWKMEADCYISNSYTTLWV